MSDAGNWTGSWNVSATQVGSSEWTLDIFIVSAIHRVTLQSHRMIGGYSVFAGI